MSLPSTFPNQAQQPKHQPHFMLVPSLACPASCSYCFGPHSGPVMDTAVLDAALGFMAVISKETRQKEIKVTFHGGEPLMAGHAFWSRALEGLLSRFTGRRLEIALQSNLWHLDDEFCRLFRAHRVEPGTSLDGPEEITDAQRGLGYFARTMAGIRKAQAHGLSIGCIATFTARNLPRWREVFDFFLEERLGFSIHAAVPPFEDRPLPDALTPAQYGHLLHEMLGYYITHRREIAVSSLDQMCQSLGAGEGKVCSFRDCLGMFLAIDPYGDIFSCQRFAGRPEHRLGTLAEHPSLTQLLSSPTALRFSERERQTREACGDCSHFEYCKGGCPYNAWAGTNTERVKDPYCEAYHEVFETIQKRMLEEMASEENINVVAGRPWDGRGHPLLKRGPLIELVREGPHPSRTARTAKRIIAAVELARGPDLPYVAARLVEMKICRTQVSGEASLRGLQESLQPKNGQLNNLYVHVTFSCQLHCTHCYARASEDIGDTSSEMPVAAVEKLVRESKASGFRQVVITGGEPLMHSGRYELLNMFAALRNEVTPMHLVLRTNLAMPLSDGELAAIATAFDQVVVSVDGDEPSHDARRGQGAYAAVVRNLERYQSVVRDIPKGGELSLACVMRAKEIEADPGQAVRKLAHELGVKRTRFRPLLPLGRAAEWDEPPVSEALGAHVDPLELIECGFHPVASCGLGQNIYIEPSGQSFPCYAYHQPHSFLGNVIEFGVKEVLESAQFRDLARHSVDTNPKCHACEFRYICGGACRAWVGIAPQTDLDIPPPECTGLRYRAFCIYGAALRFMDMLDAEDLTSKCSEFQVQENVRVYHVQRIETLVV